MGSNLSRPCVNKILTWVAEWLITGLSHLPSCTQFSCVFVKKNLARRVTPCIYSL
jgi:hypothetical protein